MENSETTEKTTPAITFLRDMVELRPGGEHRHEQEVAMRAVEKSINEGEHLLSQAGTGTGKSLSYLIPAILSGKRTVVSTATKQLSEQLVDKDIPELNRMLTKLGHSRARYSLLKGRENYLCKRKYEEAMKYENDAPASSSQEALFELNEQVDDENVKKVVNRVKEVKEVYNWADKTTTGDRSHGPAVSDEVWRSLSSTNAECPGKSSCSFGEVCFAEKARDTARSVDLVVTNHAIVGVDLIAEESSLLGEREVYIFDELHEVDNYLSKAWGTEVSAKSISDTANNIRKAVKGDKDCEETATKIMELCKVLEESLESTEKGIIDHLDVNIEAILIMVKDQMERLKLRVAYLSDGNEAKKATYKSAANQAQGIFESLEKFLTYAPDETVRWYSKRESDNSPTITFMNCAPMRIGPRLMSSLRSRDAIMVGTSATITVGGKFDSPIHDFALDEKIDNAEPNDFQAVDAGTPFDYPKQGMLHIPDNSFPAPTGSREMRVAHTEAVQEANIRFVKAAGGRSLLLMTTTYAMVQMAKQLRKALGKKSKIKVLVQGEAPNQQLVEEFIKDETSVLIATMGMWHGLDVPGKSCIYVGIDKIPFTPFDDPLANARKDYADKTGRNGFMDVYVAEANVKLAQGVGRLVRTKTDKGVVAVFDTRLRTARYGSSMLKSLPPMNIFKDADVVEKALERLGKN